VRRTAWLEPGRGCPAEGGEVLFRQSVPGSGEPIIDMNMTLTFNSGPVTYRHEPLGHESPVAPVVQRAENSLPGAGHLPGDVVKNLVDLFKLLADETRLRILFLLQQRHELNVRTLCQMLRQSQPAVSHHLALLRVAGLIEMRRDGKHNFYRLLPLRFEETLRMVFQVVPGEQIRLGDFVISFTEA
jgi:ArsR family transcriptional regulator, arsenate/arsenite/antimonite-responsive transcriptional repressor